MNKRVISILVVLALILSILPIFTAFAFNENLITGFAQILPPPDGPDKASELIKGCPCPGGTAPYSCSDPSDPEWGQPWYCDLEYNPDTNQDECTFIRDCVQCGCPVDKECDPNTGSCMVPGDWEERLYNDEYGCSDGTDHQECSDTLPLYCRKGKLSDRCDICGCAKGYYCDTSMNLCLINQNLTNLNYVGENISNTTENVDTLWFQIDQKYAIQEKGIQTSPAKLLNRASAEEKEILFSGGVVSKLTSIDVAVKEAGVEQDMVDSAQEKALVLKRVVEDPVELKKALKDEKDNPFGEDIPLTFGNKGIGAPQFSQDREDIEVTEKPCISQLKGSCLYYGCCEGLVCTAGICIENKNITAVSVRSERDENEPEKLVLKDESGFANLVNVQFTEDVDPSVLTVNKYVTHPNFAEPIDAGDNIASFGFYDIKVQNNTEVGATLSFQILNDLLVLNQIESLGVYRYHDGKWQNLELEQAIVGENYTTVTFNTPGLSYFEVLGKQKGIGLSGLGIDDTSTLWAVYTRSPEPGVSVLEVFFGYNDRLMFGNVFGTPFIDLYVDSYF